jgi:NADH-quinone oxidoreductase subunit C
VAASIFDSLAAQLVPAAGPAVVSHGILVFKLEPAELLPAVQRLKTEFAFDLFLDVTAIDWLGQAPRFEVVHHFYSTTHKQRVRLKTRVPEAEALLDSLVPLYGSAAIMERE